MSRKHTDRMTEKERRKLRKKRGRKRAFILISELIILSVLCVVAYGIFKLDMLDTRTLDKEKLEVYKDTGEYTNIALFGLDSREGELDGGVQSDTIMIASINNQTNDVKIISVFRDTLLQQSNGSYEKANSAYTMGGPQEAISMLNRNLDLDIQSYVSVNFNALVDVIDELGGIEVNLTAEEAFYTNGYAAETSKVVGQEMKDIKEEAGVQLLDGVHAVSYARIRYTEGNDFKRTERQRIVLEKVAEKAKKANLFTLNKIVDKVFPQISTNLTLPNMLGFAANAAKYNIVETSGFPYSVTTSEEVADHEGSYVVPINMADNVKRLHAALFGDELYEPSSKVWEVHSDIISLTGITEDTLEMQTSFGGEASNEESQ
ncbi:LytR family transcriptional regulator [Clostridiaceae bacterium 68-1-5]|uniref:LytR family transcriptional regulator n=1 Tax=Suipraeoptans intestinalis TaxID=2606628 RepID=A0A6N7UR05_9FIRM|nr:LCP family protein [Suipraeoptans intestinalis]MDY3122322.1 LCP family protein [Suipraeoptans intestinalis]MSR93081.1 LytR family transcriptional regulator [Suipraeoptans intestinalis]